MEIRLDGFFSAKMSFLYLGFSSAMVEAKSLLSKIDIDSELKNETEVCTMPNKILIGYDGSDVSRRALDLALEQAKLTAAAVTIAHILEWSPYSFLTPDEIEERHKRRSDEINRAHISVLIPVIEEIQKSGVTVEGVVRYGQVADVLCTLAESEKASQIYIGRHGQSGISARVFGSVASKLAQTAPIACTIVP